MYQEIKKDIFDFIEENRKTDNVVLIHCISSDWALGAGIAKKIDEVFNEKQALKDTFMFKGMTPDWTGHGYSLFHHYKDINETNLSIANLVTKEKYWNKPTYETLAEALKNALSICNTVQGHVNHKGKKLKIVMPKIGCGLDGLDWDKVSEIIKGLSDNFDITICYL